MRKGEPQGAGSELQTDAGNGVNRAEGKGCGGTETVHTLELRRKIYVRR